MKQHADIEARDDVNVGDPIRHVLLVFCRVRTDGMIDIPQRHFLSPCIK
jgi:hypothetical protein